MRLILRAWALGGLCACGRGHADPGAGVVRGEEAAPLAAASASAAPPAATPSAAPATWRGTYRSVASTLYVPPELKVTWKPSETSAGLGDGTLSMTVDPGTGRVQGELEGPLGPAILTGLATDGKLTAKIARRDPQDRGFAGTMIGTLVADRGEGTMSLSPAEGGALRSATFALSGGVAPAATR